MEKSINIKSFKNLTANSFTKVIFSKCFKYRYSFTREWDKNKKKILFILLNPSTASEIKNDATISRIETHSKNLEMGSFTVCNLFALREKNPLLLKKHKYPLGKENNNFIKINSLKADKIVCAWGNEGEYMNQSEKTKRLLLGMKQKAYVFGLTKKDNPKHPLYLSYQTSLIRWF